MAFTALLFFDAYDNIMGLLNSKDLGYPLKDIRLFPNVFIRLLADIVHLFVWLTKQKQKDRPQSVVC